MLSVALCTYNGSRYILEQLQSIAAQTLLPDEVIVSDDGSSDNTVELIQEFLLKAPFPITIFINEQSLGVVQNFAKAIEKCKGNYIALCDQDDIWFSDKLQKTMDCMKNLEQVQSGIPILVHSDLCVVDGNKQVLNDSMLQSQGLKNEPMQQALKTLLVQNYVTGCTIVFNQKLKELAMPFPEKAIMHDWWLALVAAAYGKIGFLDEPTMYYRQHGKNTVGAKRYFSFASLRKAFNKSVMILKIEKTIYQAIALLIRTNEIAENNVVLSYLTWLSHGEYFKVYNFGVRQQGILRNTIFYFFLLLYGKEQIQKILPKSILLTSS